MVEEELVSARPTGSSGRLVLENALRKAPVKQKLFVAWGSDDVAEKRDQLAVMLEKAGFDVLPKGPPPANEREWMRIVMESIQAANASVHVLGAQYGRSLIEERRYSVPRYQYAQAEDFARQAGAGKYKRFVWHVLNEGEIVVQDQMEFLNLVQNSLSDDMMFSVSNNATHFVQELRSFVESDGVSKVLTKEYDMAFLSNVTDAADCYDVIEKLSSELKVTTLTIVPDKDDDYKTLAVELVRKSRMTVVFFREASDWAVSFTKLVWKLSGGASSQTPFLLIGEDDPRRNRFLKFAGPNIKLDVVPKADIYSLISARHESIRTTGKITDEIFCPYTGLRPFNENESIFFKGRETHINTIIKSLEAERFSMVTGSSGDGKSSLIFAGVIPSLKAGFLKALYTKWVVADFRPERQPLHNLAYAITQELRNKTVEEVENALSFGFSALIDLYKQSTLYCDVTSDEYIDATPTVQREMKKQAANLLILVDQFEEFFTNTENFREGVASPVAQITINVLLETIRIAREQHLPVFVIFTMRSDYIGQCVAFRGFPELIGLSTYFVPRLKREETQEVIQAPANLNGNRISSRLVQRILNDLGEGLDQLPVLQHALYQIWNLAGQGRQEMDLVHYAIVGGLAGNKLPKEDQETFDKWFAQQPDYKKRLFDKPKLRNVLNRHANELYETAHEYYNARYSPAITKEFSQSVIRLAFTALTKIDDTRAVRNRVGLMQITQLVNNPEVTPMLVGRLLNIYREAGNTFLQPYIDKDDSSTFELPSSAVLDITHESLIRNWDKLVEWAQAENKSVSVYKEFKLQVDRWVENNMSSKDLLNIGTFTYFNAWYDERKPNSAWIRRYLLPEELAADLDPTEQSDQYLEDIEEYLSLSRQRIERNRRRVVFVIGVISTLFLFSMILAIIAQQKATEAQNQQRMAENHAKRAELERTRAESAAQEANRQRLIADQQRLIAEKKTIEAQLERMRAEDEAGRAELQRQLAEKNRLIADNQRQLAEENQRIADRQRREAELQRALALEATDQAKKSAAEALMQTAEAKKQRDNALITQSYFLAQLGEEQTDVNNPEVGLLLALRGLPKVINGPDERPYVAQTEAALYYSANAIVNEKPYLVLTGHKNRMIFNQFSPDGTKLISTSWDKTVRLWDTQTGKEISQFSGHSNIVNEAFFSADGKNVLTLSQDFSARLWNFGARDVTAVFRGHKTNLTHADISFDSKRVVTSSEDNTGILFDATTGRKIADLEGHTGAALFTAFSPDGKRLVTTSKDKTGRLWDGETGVLIAELKGHNDAVPYAAFSPDNRLLVTVSNDYNAFIWNAKTGEQIRNLRGHNGGIVHVAFSHDGKRIVTSSQDGTSKVWETATGKLLGSLNGHTMTVYSAAFTNDGKHIVTTSMDKSARVWDGISYLRLAEFKGHPTLGYQAAFSPDGKTLAMAGQNFAINFFRVLPNLQELIDYSLNSLKKRDLTKAELSKFFLQNGDIRKELEDEMLRRRRGDASAPPIDSKRSTTAETSSTRPTPPARTAAPADTRRPAPPAYTPSYTPPVVKKYEPPRYVAPVQKSSHIVQPGETLFSIAKKYNLKVEKLMELNGVSGSGLRPGMKLKLE